MARRSEPQGLSLPEASLSPHIRKDIPTNMVLTVTPIHAFESHLLPRYPKRLIEVDLPIERPGERHLDEPNKWRPERPGSAKDKILHMADDFDAPLEEFKEYMQ